MDDGSLTVGDSAKEAWKCYYEKLLIAENAWEKTSLPNMDPTKGLAIQIDSSLVK